eukprot:CAMPEP_0185818438 /NCGR_PEP_ID=MMETSP1322-20130828/20639_1 /TAXON_ID=265543 /ORGANISM="Minutocellus polymorphus, Strain RCC2270" /LENGTH=119 /DNA_ID=CAMNT_0028515545 /DNA_START=82 /DNA_END=442 /DNA_ORIENTATION=-
MTPSGMMTPSEATATAAPRPAGILVRVDVAPEFNGRCIVIIEAAKILMDLIENYIVVALPAVAPHNAHRKDESQQDGREEYEAQATPRSGGLVIFATAPVTFGDHVVLFVPVGIRVVVS